MAGERAKAVRSGSRVQHSRLLDGVFQDSLSCLALLDRQLNFIRVNPAYARAWRRPVDDFTGRNHFDVHPSTNRSVFERVVQTKEPAEIAAQPLAFPGQLERGVTYWDWTIVPLLDRHDDVQVLLLSLHDVTAHVEAAEELRMSEQRFRSLVAATSQTVWTADARGEINPVLLRWGTNTSGAESLTQQSVPEARDWAWLKALHPDDRDRVRAIWARAIEARVPYEAEFRVRRPGGESRYLAARAVAVLEPNDTVREWVGITTDITDRKRTEEALRESEERFVSAFEHAAIGMALVAPDGRFLGVNRALCELVGYTSKELLTKTFQDITHPDDLETDLAYVRQILAGEIRFYHMEKRYFHKSGDILWVLLSVSLVRDAQGEPRYFISQIKNITERKQAEREQAALVQIAGDINRTADFKTMLDIVQRRIADLLPCDRVVTYRWDKALSIYRAIAWHGIPDDLVPDTSTLGFDPGDKIVATLRAGETVLISDSGRAEGGTARVLGHARIEAMTLVPLAVYGRRLGVLVAQIEHGRGFSAHQVQLLEGIAQQVAIAMEAYEVNQAQREEAAVSTALARVGQELIASLASPNLLDVLCKVTAEVLGCDSSHTLFLQPDDDLFRPIAAYGETPEEQEIVRVVRIPRHMLGGLFPRLEEDDVAEVQAADSNLHMTAEQRAGRHLCIALRRGKETIGVQVASRRNSTISFGTIELGIGRGIAQLASLTLEHARVRQELEQSNNLKSEFVATMSHELRTPLNIIIGYTDLVVDHALGPLNPEQVDVIQRVGKSARELEELIRATLDMSRLEKGEIPLDLEVIRLAEVLAEVAAATEDARHKPGVEMHWDIPANLPSLQTDRVKLKVILRNLLGNALKFTDQGAVKLAVRVRGEGVEFSVSDTGIGIREDSVPIIFEPFRQAENSVTHRYGGVGLGLYIVRRLVEALGGTISVDTVLGHGSTFRVWLPQGGASPLKA